MFWVARAFDDDNKERGRVVGCAGISMHECVGELHRMYLYRDYRGRGIGRRLLDTSIDHLKTCGVRRMLLWSDVKFTDAHRLYERNGFKRFGERICNDPDANREYGYAKEPL
jgi:GNAT superfamily N-acetyltransferase